MRLLSEEEVGGYIIEFPDNLGYIAGGARPEEAIKEGTGALSSYLGTLKELSRSCSAAVA